VEIARKKDWEEKMIDDTKIESREQRLIFKRHFEAPREIIFRAWTDASWLVRWMGPQECTCPQAKTDLHVGGALKIVIRNSEGKDHTAHGIYQTVDAPARLSFTWQWEQEDGTLGHEMLIDIELLDRDNGTDMVFTQTRFPTEESRDQHKGGWTGAIQCLADALDDLIQDS
jgi:uncharacterized protein YndB with AHSA1/START domain